MALDNQDLFSIYVAGLAKAAGLPASPPNFILTGTALPANLAYNSKGLGQSAPSLGQALAQVYNLADTQLFPNGFFDQSTDSFFDDYATYIDNLTPQNAQPPTPTQQGQINLIKASLATASSQYNTDLTAAFAAYQQIGGMLPGQYPTFQSYLSQTSWGGTLSNDSNAMNGFNSQLNTIYSAVYGQDYVAIQLAKTTVDGVRAAKLGSVATSPTVMSITVTGGTQVVPDYVPGDLSMLSQWVDNAIQQHVDNEPKITINFGSSASTYDFSKSTYFKQSTFSANFWFWSAGGSSTSSSTQVNVDSSSSKFNLRMGFDAITTVPLAAGPWFDSSLMYAYANQGGLIRPTSLLVAMYPSITLTMDANSYASAQAAYNTSSGFGVGAFWVSASTKTSSTGTSFNAAWNASSNSVTITSGSIVPVIVGMLVAPA